MTGGGINDGIRYCSGEGSLLSTKERLNQRMAKHNFDMAKSRVHYAWAPCGKPSSLACTSETGCYKCHQECYHLLAARDS